MMMYPDVPAPAFDGDECLLFAGERYCSKARRVELVGTSESNWTEREYAFELKKVRAKQKVYFTK
jgi:hypothetical protein